jgi:hypothetical protein
MAQVVKWAKRMKHGRDVVCPEVEEILKKRGATSTLVLASDSDLRDASIASIDMCCTCHSPRPSGCRLLIIYSAISHVRERRLGSLARYVYFYLINLCSISGQEIHAPALTTLDYLSPPHLLHFWSFVSPQIGFHYVKLNNGYSLLFWVERKCRWRRYPHLWSR